MPTIPRALTPELALREPAAGAGGRVAAALDQAAALWAARATAAAALSAPPDPARFPDPQAFSDALEDWRDAIAAAAEDALEGRPEALQAWRAWFDAESGRLAPHLEQAGLAAAMQRAGEGLRAELDAARRRALAPVRPGDAEAASRDARNALDQAVALGVLDQAEAERTAAGLAAQVQPGLAAALADQDPAGFAEALRNGDFPALDQAVRQRLKDRAALRLALAEAAEEQEAARREEDAKRLPAELGRHLLRRAEAALKAALEGGDPADVQDAALELATGPGFTAQAKDLAKSLETLPAARALLGRTAFDPPAARFAALDEAAEGWPGPLARACREVLDESAADLARDPAGFVRPEAERKLRALGLDPRAEREALLHAVLDLQAGCDVEDPCVLSLAENAALRQEWRGRDAAGRVQFLASLAGFAGFRHRVAAEVLGARGPVLLLAAESPALCPAEKTAVLTAACAPASRPAQDQGEVSIAAPPALAALAASEPQAATVLADLAARLAATDPDPDAAPRLLAALAPEALRLWGQAPALTPQSEHESAYRQDDAGSLDQIGDENTTPPKPDEEDDTLKGGAEQDTLPGETGNATATGGQEGKESGSGTASKSLLINPTGGVIRQDTKGSGFFGSPRKKTKGKEEIHYEHEGVDYEGVKGQSVNAPLSGTMRVDSKGNVIIQSDPEIDGSRHRVALVHVVAGAKPGSSGIRVNQGDVVASVQDPADYAGSGGKGMKPHVHTKLEIVSKDGERRLVNPDEYMPNPAPWSEWRGAGAQPTSPYGRRSR